MSDSNDIYSPYVMLKEKNEFVFFYSVASSTFPFGKYTIEDNRLILKCDEEGVGTYVFEIDNTTLIFLANDSTPIPEFSGQSPVEDKSRFELITK